MQKQVIEITKETRDSNIQRNALNLQNVVDSIKLILENVDELNHLDYDYISAIMGKSLMLLSNVNYILENYMQKPTNPFFEHIKKNA